MLVLDTDVLTLMLRGREEAAERLRTRLAAEDPEGVVTTVITYEEQMRGWMAYASKARSVAEQVRAYQRLESNLDDFKHVRLLSFSEAAAVAFQRLRKFGLRIGTMDLRIAAIALTHDATVLTRNLRDFQKVPGLKAEDWSS